ncbi:hypothetical protein LTR70_009448 [Exophiala xenobiotica]|uniref:Uncharacterized protein n=1 Tax=Lithohypha guttulata TaxID=1690604 RepID=A0ABR0JYB2_9EURO|nr:hypothetical protein LTR24_008987 [Lithohypha guttulata]KAK5310478.1 hypothetical protein LTR70_009448 [Exophiala xenobiotica]
MLDEEDPEMPVVLVYDNYHGWYTNAVGLKRAGCDLAGGDMDRVGGQHTPRADGSLTENVMDRAECRLMVAIAKPLVMHTTSVMKRTVLETYHNGTMSYQDAAASELLLPALRNIEPRGIQNVLYEALLKTEWVTEEIQSLHNRTTLSIEDYRS